MKSLHIYSVILLLCSFGVSAQTQLGLVFNYSKGTAKPSAIQLDNVLDILLYDFDFKGQHDVISLGISSYKDLGPFFIKADVLFRETSFTFEITNFIDRFGSIHNQYKTKYSLFHIPISAGFRLKKIRLGAGPIVNIVMDSELHDDFYDIFTIKKRKRHFGFQFLFGINVTKHIQLEAKYENTFTDLTDGYYQKDMPIKMNTSPNLFTLGLGFYL